MLAILFQEKNEKKARFRQKKAEKNASIIEKSLVKSDKLRRHGNLVSRVLSQLRSRESTLGTRLEAWKKSVPIYFTR